MKDAHGDMRGKNLSTWIMLERVPRAYKFGSDWFLNVCMYNEIIEKVWGLQINLNFQKNGPYGYKNNYIKI